MIGSVLTVLGMVALLVLIRVVRGVREDHRAGKSMDAAVKHALFLMMVRLDEDLTRYPYEVGDDLRKLLVPAVLSLLAGSEGVRDVDESFIKEHREDVEMFAQAVLARDTELRTLVLSTRIWLYAVRRAYTGSAAAEPVLDNPLLKPYERDSPPISGDQYLKLVGKFSEAWLTSDSKSTGDADIREEDIPF